MKSLRNTFPALGWALAAALVAACGSSGFQAPKGMTALGSLDNSKKLTERFFPGFTGSFYAEPAGKEGGPVFGIVRSVKEPGKVFLAGAGKERSWSKDIPLEREGVRIAEVEPVHFFIGDVQQDGLADLFLVLDIKSTDDKSGKEQERRAVYLFELAKQLKLTWYQTLRYEGTFKGGKSAGFLRYNAEPSFKVDDAGRLTEILISHARTSLSCEGAKDSEKQACARDRNNDEFRLVWDDDLRTYRPAEEKDATLQIPDVSL